MKIENRKKFGIFLFTIGINLLRSWRRCFRLWWRGRIEISCWGGRWTRSVWFLCNLAKSTPFMIKTLRATQCVCVCVCVRACACVRACVLGEVLGWWWWRRLWICPTDTSQYFAQNHFLTCLPSTGVTDWFLDWNPCLGWSAKIVEVFPLWSRDLHWN